MGNIWKALGSFGGLLPSLQTSGEDMWGLVGALGEETLPLEMLAQ